MIFALLHCFLHVATSRFDGLVNTILAFPVEILDPAVGVLVDERALIESHLGKKICLDPHAFQDAAPGGGKVAGEKHGASRDDIFSHIAKVFGVEEVF